MFVRFFCIIIAVTSYVYGDQIKDKRPNILLILSDDQGYGDAGFQGSKDIKTPNLDRLAGSGLICTNGYVTHPYCSPSRAGLMTGRYQSRFGHERNPRFGTDEGLPLNQKLMPQYLKEAGYTTGWIGKWHLGDSKPYQPGSRGFDQCFGFYGGGHQFLNWKPNPKNEYCMPIMKDGKEVNVTGHLTSRLGKEAAEFVQRNATDKKPWFLYLAFNAPHTPNQPTPEKYAEMSHIPNSQRRAYAAEVSHMDDAIGDVMQALKESGQIDNTLVFFLSDNGGRDIDNEGESLWHGADNGGLRGGKGHVYEGGVRVPFVVSWPAQLPKGKKFDHPISSLDLLPTIMASAKQKLPTNQHYDGMNILPFLNSDKQKPASRTLFWRRSEWRVVGMRQDHMKLVRKHGIKDQLFNLKNDSAEQENIAIKQYDYMQQMEDELDKWLATLAKKDAFLGEGPEPEPQWVPPANMPEKQ